MLHRPPNLKSRKRWAQTATKNIGQDNIASEIEMHSRARGNIAME